MPLARAAVQHGIDEPLAIEEVEIASPIGREVLVRTLATGVCGSDLHMLKGEMGRPLPTIPGHESAGVVEAVGPQVTHVQPGDHVVCCLSTFCGECERCLSGQPNICERRDLDVRPEGTPPRISQGGEPVHQFARVSGFAELLLVHENTVVQVPADTPMEQAALVGCSVVTGVGAVFNTARLEPGSTAAVFGAGGVGLSVIQGARLAGAREVIAVDMRDDKLEVARGFGATQVVNASRDDPVRAIRDLVRHGVDYAFEAIGLARTTEQAFVATRPGGTAVLVGIIPDGVNIELSGRHLLADRRLMGSSMGSNRFRFDIPKYLDLYRQGRLQLDELISHRSTLDRVNEAFTAMEAGERTRTVLTFG
jgi:S-(hydroxymethyl)glutathione dehydrogenase/alcohol dehydrogenase